MTNQKKNMATEKKENKMDGQENGQKKTAG